jgi:hypothetical protein
MEELEVALLARRDAGDSIEQAAAYLIERGTRLVDSIRLLRRVYGVELAAAKAAVVLAETGKTLEQTQAELVPELREALADPGDDP